MGGMKRKRAGVRDKGVLEEFRKEPRPVGGVPTATYGRCQRSGDKRLKRRYRTLADAERVADIHSVTFGQVLSAYLCECGWYHIGKPGRAPAEEEQDG